MGVEEHDDRFGDIDLSNLKLDEAYVQINNSDDKNYLYLRSDDCYKCPFRPFDQFVTESMVKMWFIWNILCILIKCSSYFHKYIY